VKRVTRSETLCASLPTMSSFFSSSFALLLTLSFRRVFCLLVTEADTSKRRSFGALASATFDCQRTDGQYFKINKKSMLDAQRAEETVNVFPSVLN